MRRCQLSDWFLLPQYKQGRTFHGHAAPHRPGAAREVGERGRGREGGAGGASRYPAQGGAKGGRWDKRVKQSQLADMLR